MTHLVDVGDKLAKPFTFYTQIKMSHVVYK